MKHEVNTEGLSILVAEDNPTIRHLLSYNLKQRHFAVYEAENGRQAVDYLTDIVPNLVVLDVAMPLMTGIEVCDWIRQHGITVPVLILTAHDETAIKKRAIEAGANDFMTKPFIMDEFLTRVWALLQGSKA